MIFSQTLFLKSSHSTKKAQKELFGYGNIELSGQN